ncbi:MAG: hypothetical protein M1290_00845 [Candidatus Thermoplasmatota archaeon]|jgi:hypothetical protein|nr:hypothetical protein [Candidatus Thermoplasmatota archaeon]MCL5788997.1 hypothetical protein [Candidatus Thermoplasmatota archaeon]
MTENVERQAFTKRWKEFNARKKTQSLMRTASSNYSMALKNIENRWYSEVGRTKDSGNNRMLVIQL